MNVPQDIAEFLIKLSESETKTRGDLPWAAGRTLENMAWRLCQKHKLYGGGPMLAELAGGFEGELEGLKVHKVTMFSEYLGKDIEYNEYDRHEYAPARYFNSLPENLVVAINGQNYVLDVELDSRCECPERVTVQFSKTTMPESESLEWDEQEALEKRRNRAVDDLEEYAVLQAENPDEDWETFAGWAKRDIAKIDAGEMSLMSPYDYQVFGQPQFIQGEAFPNHNGKLAYHLMTIDTGWGDSGNVNIFFACDESGEPCRVWFEASCC